MGRVPFPGISEETEELVALSKSATRREYMRLQALLLIKKELVASRQHIADILSVHRQTVSEWLKNYEKGGLPLLLEDDKPGPTSQRTLPEEVFVALGDKLNTEEGFGSYHEVVDWLEQEHGIQANYYTLWSMIQREFGGKLKTPRPSHPKKTTP